MTLILAGQGNPGPKYEKNRHNVGFMAMDAIARRWATAPWRARFQGLACEGQVDTPDGPVQLSLAMQREFAVLLTETGRKPRQGAKNAGKWHQLEDDITAAARVHARIGKPLDIL